MLDPHQFLALGWYKLEPAKIRKSMAEWWVFVILDLRQQASFVVVPLKVLKRRMPKGVKLWHLYLTVFSGGRCFNTRGMTQADQWEACNGGRVKPRDNYSAYVNNWTFKE